MASGKVLIVDDQPINVQLLRRKLEQDGVGVIVAYTGADALVSVAAEKPDLILLDMMMPDMDGRTVCQKLQQDEATRSIPVIFITASTAKEAKLEGLAVGAVDYITKPIDLDETSARVRTQLRVVQVNREMLDLQRRLEESRRAATIGAVTHGIAHNLNNLLGVVLGYLDLIKAQASKPESVKANAENVEKAVQRIVTIVKQLTSLAGRSRPPMLAFPLQRLLDNAVRRFQAEYKIEAPVTINNSLGGLAIDTHLEIFEDILAKVLINAWESYGAKPQGEPRPIDIRTAQVTMPSGQSAIEIRIEDRGLGLAASVKDTLFEPFISTKETVGVGMGLTVARHALRNMGGEITVSDRKGGGAVAILVHPISKSSRGHA
ncbi:MAG: response regulator [Opitutaceae bacterium]|nr:response regulator [Opitutaceae bacterium]